MKGETSVVVVVEPVVEVPVYDVDVEVLVRDKVLLEVKDELSDVDVVVAVKLVVEVEVAGVLVVVVENVVVVVVLVVNDVVSGGVVIVAGPITPVVDGTQAAKAAKETTNKTSCSTAERLYHFCFCFNPLTSLE